MVAFECENLWNEIKKKIFLMVNVSMDYFVEITIFIH